jgi:hypothetical protein
MLKTYSFEPVLYLVKSEFYPIHPNLLIQDDIEFIPK